MFRGGRAFIDWIVRCRSCILLPVHYGATSMLMGWRIKTRLRICSAVPVVGILRSRVSLLLWHERMCKSIGIEYDHRASWGPEILQRLAQSPETSFK